MAVEKGLVMAVIERKLSGKSLTKNFKESIATKWAAKIESDDQIESYVEDREDLLLEASAEGDRRANTAVKPKVETETITTKTEESSGEETEIQKLMKMVGALSTEVGSLKTEKEKATVSDLALKHEALKDVPKSYLKGRSLPAKAEDVEAWANEVKTDYTAFATEHKIGKADDKPRFGGTRVANTNEVKPKAATDPAVKNIVGKLNI